MRLPNTEVEDRPPEINVVALIDVIFAILTFFIVTSLTLIYPILAGEPKYSQSLIPERAFMC